jgi:hypothetical protein
MPALANATTAMTNSTTELILTAVSALVPPLPIEAVVFQGGSLELRKMVSFRPGRVSLPPEWGRPMR